MKNILRIIIPILLSVAATIFIGWGVSSVVQTFISDPAAVVGLTAFGTIVVMAAILGLITFLMWLYEK